MGRNQGNMGRNQGNNMGGNQGNIRSLTGNQGGNVQRSPRNSGGGMSARGIDLPMTNTSIKFDTSYPSFNKSGVSSLMSSDMGVGGSSSYQQGGMGGSGASGNDTSTLDLIRSLKEELK